MAFTLALPMCERCLGAKAHRVDLEIPTKRTSIRLCSLCQEKHVSSGAMCMICHHFLDASATEIRKKDLHCVSCCRVICSSCRHFGEELSPFEHCIYCSEDRRPRPEHCQYREEHLLMRIGHRCPICLWYDPTLSPNIVSPPGKVEFNWVFECFKIPRRLGSQKKKKVFYGHSFLSIYLPIWMFR